jgi:hypothetical protein
MLFAEKVVKTEFVAAVIETGERQQPQAHDA